MWWVWWIFVFVGALSGSGYFLWHYMGGDQKYWPKRGVYLLEYSKIISLWDRFTFKYPFHLMDELIYKHFKENGIRYGGAVELRNPVLYVTDLETVKYIMLKDFDSFVNRRSLIDMSKTDPLFHKMLILLKDQEWKDMRSTMSPTFTTGKIRRMYEIFDESSNKMAKFLKQKIVQGSTGNEIEMRAIFTRYTLDVIASAAFGLDSQNFGETESEFCTMVRRIQTVSIPRMVKFFFIFLFPKVAAFFRIPISDKISSEFFAEVTRKAIKHREDTGEVRDDFLQLMIDAKHDRLKDDNGSEVSGNKVKLTESHVLSQSLLFFFAGFDTMETLLIFASYELAVHPDIQERLFTELRQGYEKNGGKLNYDLVMKFEYLDKVVSEVLRKYPPGIRTERVSSRVYQLPESDLVLDKGSTVVVSVYGIHHDEQYFPDPEKFDPERFSHEAKAARHPYAYMPFGVGPRNCIAMRFALAEAKAAVAQLILNFKLEPVAKTPIPMKFSRVQGMKPDGGKLFLSVVPRPI